MICLFVKILEKKIPQAGRRIGGGTRPFRNDMSVLLRLGISSMMTKNKMPKSPVFKYRISETDKNSDIKTIPIRIYDITDYFVTGMNETI